jgi:hypothetical protein
MREYGLKLDNKKSIYNERINNNNNDRTFNNKILIFGSIEQQKKREIKQIKRIILSIMRIFNNNYLH